MRFSAPARAKRSPEAEEEIRREIDTARAAAKKEGRSYVMIYWLRLPSQELGEDALHTDGEEF